MPSPVLAKERHVGVDPGEKGVRRCHRGNMGPRIHICQAHGRGAPLPQVRFCPTGGVTPANAPSYLGLSNTLCVGGSWVAPQALIDVGDWEAITDLARTAAAL